MRQIVPAMMALSALVLWQGGAGAADAPQPPGAAEAPKPLAETLVGNTLSGVLFMPHEAPAGGGSLDRVVFQAFLRSDGSAQMRRWDSTHDAYTAIAPSRWNLDGDTLCLDFPANERVARTCIEIHVWGPRIAGNTAGAGPFALLDGSIEPGNTIVAGR